jgi:acyl-CoA thioesterase I
MLHVKPYGLKPSRFNRLLLALLMLVATARPALAEPIRILALGDSLTAGLGLSLDDSYPTCLQAALNKDGHDVSVINGGISGDTSAGGLARLDWALADHPRFALVELGANDALRGISPAVTKDNLDRILAKLVSAGVRPVLLGMKAPENWGAGYVRDFDRIYPDLAAKYKIPLYPFFLEGVALDPKYIQPDGLHPNAAGVGVIVGHVLPVVEQALADQH